MSIGEGGGDAHLLLGGEQKCSQILWPRWLWAGKGQDRGGMVAMCLAYIVVLFKY